MNALASQGGTICVAPGTYTEDVSVPFRAPMTIIGTSFDQVHVTSLTAPGASPVDANSVPNAKLTLKGLDLQMLVVHRHMLPTDSSVDVLGVRVVPKPGFGGNSFLNCPANIPVLFDGCDLSHPDEAAIQICTFQGDSSSVTIQNSWFHDSFIGVSLYSGDSEEANLQVRVFNNTFTNNSIGLYATMQLTDVTYANNVFAANDVAVDIVEPSEGHHNAYEMNTTKFDHAAVPGEGDVDTGCALDAATSPPSLAAGSTCIDAADPATSAPTDFWGAPRGPKPDIGAVEAP